MLEMQQNLQTKASRAGLDACAAPSFASPVPCGHTVHALAALKPGPGPRSGTLLFTAGRDGSLRGYSAGGTEECAVSCAHAGRIWALAAVHAGSVHAGSTPTPAHLASASVDSTVKLWSLAPTTSSSPRLERLATLCGHQGPVHALLSYRGLLASGGDDCTVRLWDPSSLEQRAVCALPIATPCEERTSVYSLAESVAGLWCGNWGGSLGLWDAAYCMLLFSVPQAHGGAVWAMQQLPQHVGGTVASASADGVVRVWDARQSRAAAQVGTACCALYTLAWHEAGALVFGGYDGVLRAWEPRAARMLFTVRAHTSPIRSLLAHEGTLWSGATDGTVSQWSMEQLTTPS